MLINVWAYSSAWLERIPDKDEVVSSNIGLFIKKLLNF